MTRYLPLVLVAFVAALAAAWPAHADQPAISTKQAQAAQVLAELRGLDDRLERSVEAYNLARIKLASNARALKTNGHHLGVARRNLTSAQRRLAARLVYLYTTEEPDSSLGVILGAGSLGELLDRLDTAQRVADQDALVLREVRAFKAGVVRQRQALRREHAPRSRLVAELASRRAEIEAQLAERRQLLASIKDDIARLQARERARQE